MAISASQIKDLREKTGAGMMDCKKALTETNGDVEAAVDWLRKNGLAKAAKKAGRTAAEGLVAVAEAGNKAVVVEVNSETDFVARNEDFQKLVSTIAEVALSVDGDLDALRGAAYPGSDKNVEEFVAEQVGVIGENLSLRRSAGLSVTNGVVATYIHNSVKPGLGKIGVLVALESDGDKAQLTAVGKQVAMHVAAARPEALTVEELDPSKLEREREVLREQALASGKPAEIVEKMLEGRIRKYYEEVVLPEQVFVIDGKAKVKEFLSASEKEVGAPIKLTGYQSFIVGEGIEKEESDFASEVQAAASGAA